jgi:hypothetical protein
MLGVLLKNGHKRAQVFWAFACQTNKTNLNLERKNRTKQQFVHTFSLRMHSIDYNSVVHRNWGPIPRRGPS